MPRYDSKHQPLPQARMPLYDSKHYLTQLLSPQIDMKQPVTPAMSVPLQSVPERASPAAYLEAIYIHKHSYTQHASLLKQHYAAEVAHHLLPKQHPPIPVPTYASTTITTYANSTSFINSISASSSASASTSSTSCLLRHHGYAGTRARHKGYKSIYDKARIWARMK